MKSLLVIGLGRFGKHLSLKLAELGNDVMIVDTSEEQMTEIIPYVTSAQIGDCTNEAVLRSLGVNNFDMCFVCIGTNFQSSLEITSLLKELGAKYVVSKAKRDIHAKFLLRNGADEVVYPDKDMAEKLAYRKNANNVFDFIELSDHISIYEIPLIPSWYGKTIAQVNVRSNYHINIIAIKANGELLPLPKADHVFQSNEHIIVIGDKQDVSKIVGKM